MRRRRYGGPPMSSREGMAGLRARLARAATAPRPCGVFPITVPTLAETSRDFIGPLNPHVGSVTTITHKPTTLR